MLFDQVANLVDANYLYALKVSVEDEIFKLKVEVIFKGGDDKNLIDSSMSVYEGLIFYRYILYIF